LLKREKEFEVTDMVKDGNRVLELMKKKTYDVCVLDINMPGLDGMAAAKHIRKNWPETPIIILTTHSDRGFIFEMLREGVAGYVLKSATRDELVNAIKKVYNKENFYSEEVTKVVMSDYLNKVKKEKPGEGNPVHLTQRETEIVQLLAREYTNEKIAITLHISYRTVETHRKNIMQKTGAQNLAGLIKFAYANGIIE
jgi:DNA-binding NarL/FixJ family response regulator